VDLSKFSRDDLIVGGLALLLAIILLFFPWFHISASFGGITVSADSTATGDPDGWLGILSVLVLLGLLVNLVVDRLEVTDLPGGDQATIRWYLAAGAIFLLVLKFLFHINHFSDLGWGFWFALVVSGALLYFAYQASKGVTVVATGVRSRGSPPPPPPSSPMPPSSGSTPPPA
jgi:hypothetical protein